VILDRKTYARRSGRDRFEIVTPSRIFILKEIKSGESNEWIDLINITIN
jgi:hypothetical protein